MRCLLVAGVWAGFSFMVQGGSISFSGTIVDLNGTGFGNVLNVLSVQQNRSEYGAVIWNGAEDVLTGDAKNTSSTRTAAALQSNGIGGSKFAIYFNGNEPGNASSVSIHDFKMHFFGGDGSSLFDAAYTAPFGGLSISDFGGTGQAGWLFELTLSGAEVVQFFSVGTNRIGMSIGANQAITDTAGGAENFFVGGLNEPSGSGDPVPEPGSIAVWMIGLVAVVRAARLNKGRRVR